MNTNDSIRILMDKLIKQDFYKLLDGIKEEYDRVCREKDFYENKYRTYNKDEEISMMQNRINDTINRCIHICSDNQFRKVSDFRTEHYIKCKNGNHFIYDILSNGIFDVVKIKCPVCGEEYDVTDEEV